MKRNYLLSIIVIGLITLSLYSTYAMFTSSVETNDIISMDSVMNYTFKINGTQNLKVSANSKLRFNAIVENDMKDKISYGLYYKMINPEILPEGVVIAEVTDADILTTKGTINENSQIIVPLVIRNTTSEEVTIEIGLITGYATETQGVDQLIYSNGQIPITEKFSPEEVGDDSCSSTMECTEECILKKVDNNWVKFCYCNTGEISSSIPANDYIFDLYNNAPKSHFINNNIRYERAESVALMTDIGGNIRYYGADPNNYVKFNNELWRIIGVFKDIEDETGKKETRIKIARNDSIDNYAWDNNNINNWSTATLNTYLNGTYLNSLNSKSKALVGNAKWNLGGSSSYEGLYANDYYKFERGTTVYSGHSTEWTGKIALMYPSDFMYAGDLSKCSKNGFNWYTDQTNCRDTSWLRNPSATQWTLSPCSSFDFNVFNVINSGMVSDRNIRVMNSLALRPVLFLTSTVQITGGTGTYENPYTLG